jgi:tRNA(Ile)-lysidine synthase
VSIAERAVRDDEADVLFRGLEDARGLILAVSGGPDSTALMLLAAHWAKRRKRAPKLVAVTVDHGLRPEAAREAAAVKRLAKDLGIVHRTLAWRGRKPKSGLQEAARIARYRLLADIATRAGYVHVLTAHTLDDQAETILFRLARGSGLLGLAGMAHASPLPVGGETSLFLVRPLLGLPKARLIATLAAERIAYSEDPSNRDPRFTRVRLRGLMSDLAREGLDARGLARFAVRVRRAEATLEFATRAARAALAPGPWPPAGPITFATAQFANLPAEVALRLLGRAVAHAGDEGPVELGKLEALYDALRLARSRLRRTLAGAQITLDRERLTVERAPARRNRAGTASASVKARQGGPKHAPKNGLKPGRKRRFTK